MYNKFEELYKNIKTDNRFSYLLIITYIVFAILSIVFKNSFAWILSVYIILVILILYTEMLNIVGINFWNKPLLIRKEYRLHYYNVRKNSIINFLQTNKSFSKENLKEIIEHYRSRLPVNLKNNLFVLILSILAILVIFVDSDTGNLKEYAFTNGLATIIGISVVISVGIFVFNSTKEVFGYIFKKYSIDNELEKIFSEIYLEFDNYEIEQIKSKKNNKTRKKLS